MGTRISGNASPSIFVSISCLGILLLASAAHAGLTHDYEFNNTLADSLGGPALTSLGGSIIPGGYSFGANQGLSLSSALPAAGDNYTIDLSFSFSTLSGFRKILDFKDLTSDNGLYNLNTDLNFFNASFGPTGAFAPDTLVRVDLTRDASTGTTVGYVNGVQQVSFVDTTNIAVFDATNNIINFFIDDDVTGQREASDGFVNQIRIYDAPLSAADVALLGGPKVPEPASLVTLLAVAVPAFLRRHRS